jgi:hypothetical protein
MNATTEPPPGAELYHKAKRSRRRRDVRIWGFVVVAIAGLLMIPRITMPALLRTTAGEPGWRVFQESKKGWTLTYPANWHAQRIAEVSKDALLYTSSAYGILVSNIEHEMDHPKSVSRGTSFHSWTPSRFDARGLPATLVAVQVVWSYGGGIVPNCLEWGDPFPLSLKNAEKKLIPQGASGTPQEQLSLSFRARHERLYSLTAWIGSSASAEDRAILERIVSSISFPDTPKNLTKTSAICGF